MAAVVYGQLLAAHVTERKAELIQPMFCQLWRRISIGLSHGSLHSSKGRLRYDVDLQLRKVIT